MKKLLIVLLLFPLFFASASTARLTFRGGSPSPYLLLDLESRNAQFRLSLKKSEDTLKVNFTPFFRIRLNSAITLGEFKTGLLYSTLDGSQSSPVYLDYSKSIFKEPSGLSMEPQYCGISFLSDSFSLAYSYPSTLLASAGTDRFYSAVLIEGIPQSALKDLPFQTDWNSLKMPGLNIRLLSGLNSSFSIGEVKIKSSSYALCIFNGRGHSFQINSVMEAETEKLTAGTGVSFAENRKNTLYFKSSNISLSFERTLGPEPVYGLTSQERTLEQSLEVDFMGFTLKTVHTRENRKDNSDRSRSTYKLKYSKSGIKAELGITADRTEGTSFRTPEINIGIKDADIEFRENKIRLVITLNLKADPLSLKVSADQDRIYTFVLTLSSS
ncbi:MAG: hypothetical protein K5634_06065 [Sphaerochaetaceae bacterium]|nr:hypothetical protein [Sphaerochaetaceae bacterium]